MKIINKSEIQNSFYELVSIIEKAREKAFQAVNNELICMYWNIGKFISEKVKIENWGKSIVSDFSNHVLSRFKGIKGFSPQNIWRMKQFYETYSANEKLSPLVRELICLVAIEQKIGSLKPDHPGQLEFYLEALDRDVKKPTQT